MAEKTDNQRRSFEQVALPHLDSIYRAAVALCGRRDEAEDLAQATLLKALERFETFEPGTNCRAWLLQILRNLWIDKLRHRKVTGALVPLDDALVTEEAPVAEIKWSVGSDLLESFSDEQVIEALKQLPEDQRLTLFLIDVEQLSQEETARITGVVVGTVKSRLCHQRGPAERAAKRSSQSHPVETGFRGRDCVGHS